MRSYALADGSPDNDSQATLPAPGSSPFQKLFAGSPENREIRETPEPSRAEPSRGRGKGCGRGRGGGRGASYLCSESFDVLNHLMRLNHLYSVLESFAVIESLDVLE